MLIVYPCVCTSIRLHIYTHASRWALCHLDTYIYIHIHTMPIMAIKLLPGFLQETSELQDGWVTIEYPKKGCLLTDWNLFVAPVSPNYRNSDCHSHALEPETFSSLRVLKGEAREYVLQSTGASPVWFEICLQLSHTIPWFHKGYLEEHSTNCNWWT
jgi:hypothetical protein